MADDYLKKKVEHLEAQLQEKEDEVIKVAQIGKTLLENNTDLQNQLQKVEEQNVSNLKKIEELDQEKFSLAKKLESKAFMEKSYLEEIDSLKTSLSKQKNSIEELMQADFNVKLAEVRNKYENSQADVDRLSLIEKQLQNECDEMSSLVKDLREKLEHQDSIHNETMSEDLAKLHTQNTELTRIKDEMEHDIKLCRHKIEQLEMSNNQAEEKVSRLTQTIEEKECTLVSYQNALETAQEEVQDLQVQLDAAHMEQTDLKKKGNSLFSEVEDRRLHVEREFVHIRVENESLTKQLKMYQQQMHQMKIQMAGMLARAETKVDRNRLQFLESQLANSREEVFQLTNKLQQVEKQKTGRTEDMIDFHQAFSQETKTDHYMDFIKAKLKSKDDEIEKVKKELHSKTMLLLGEEDKCQTTAQKLYSTESELERTRRTNHKMKLQLDELKMKYEPGEFMRKHSQQVFYEKLPDPEDTKNEEKENFNIVETHIKMPSDSKKDKKDKISTSPEPQASSGSVVFSPINDTQNKQSESELFKNVSTKRTAASKLKSGGVSEAPKSRKVTISDEVEEIDCTVDSQNETNCSDSSTATKGEKHRKSIRVSAATGENMGNNDCKTQ